jgi:hypothetical protein
MIITPQWDSSIFQDEMTKGKYFLKSPPERELRINGNVVSVLWKIPFQNSQAPGQE